MKTLRDYYSWSQHSMWLSSPKQYYKKYCLGEESHSNVQFEKGKEFGMYKETGHIPGWVRNPYILEVVGDAVPELEIMEHEVRAKIGDYELLSFIDSGMSDYSDFFEYKTGEEPWTQLRVDKHKQLDFYALSYYIMSGQKTIPNCKLIWIETKSHILENGKKEIEYTGHVEEFERKFTKDDMVRMMAEIITAIKDIEAYEYKELSINEDKASRLKTLSLKLKELKEEHDLLKLEILTEMESNKVKYATSESGNFTLTERKSWSFTKELTTKENKYKDEIKSLKAKEQKEGLATYKIGTSLTFKASK